MAPRLEVRVRVENAGGEETGPLTVVGELFGERREARVRNGIPPGSEAAVIVDFDTGTARPGVHALSLLLEHPVDGPRDAAGQMPVASRRAVVLVTVGSPPRDAVVLDVPCPEDDACASIAEVEGQIIVHLESADGQAHRVRLRALTARGLRPGEESREVEVPASGRVSASVPIVRAGAPRGSRHGLVLVTETVATGVPVRTTTTQALVEVAPDRSVVARLRWPLLGAGLALLVAAALAERRAPRLTPGDPSPSADPGP